MKTRDIALGAAVLIGGYAAYQYFSKPTPPQGYAGAQYLGAGQNYNGFYNTTGQPVWLQATNGAVSIVNSLGQVLQTLANNGTFGSGGTGYTGGNNNPDSGQGHWGTDYQGNVVWIANA